MTATENLTVLGKPLPKTKQEYLDRVFEALREGKLPASTFDEEGKADSCQYRTADGRACMVGLLMPDDHPELGDNKKVISIRPELLTFLPEWLPEEEADRLQSLHNKTAYEVSVADFPSVFAAKLKEDPLFVDCVFPEFVPPSAS